MIEATLGRLAAGIDLNREELAAAIDAIVAGRCTDGEIGLLLTGLRLKGETVAEVAGAAEALRRHMVPIRSERTGIVDTCGTGGDGTGTFNISTAAALVAAAAGVPVAKHGNRKVTSQTGSADVLSALGVNVTADVSRVEACLNELGICFCFAPLLHPSMKQVADVRRRLGVPTIFNILGPLCNPAGAPFQVIGVGRPALRQLLAEALALLGCTRAIVVHGDDGLDEVTLGASTRVIEVAGGATRELTWDANDFGLAPVAIDEIQAEGPDQSAELIRGVLRGDDGPDRRIVAANAAAALWVAGKASDPAAGAMLACDAIDSGAAQRLLEQLVRLSNA